MLALELEVNGSGCWRGMSLGFGQLVILLWLGHQACQPLFVESMLALVGVGQRVYDLATWADSGLSKVGAG